MSIVASFFRRVERWPTSVSAFTALLSLLVAAIALALQLLTGPPDSAPIVALMENEASLTAAGDVDSVVALYEPDAIVRDLGVSFESAEAAREAQRWIGLDRIRERYEMLKASAIFPELVHLNITVTFDAAGTMARAISSTEGTMRWNGGPDQRITTQGGEEWEFRKVDGAWKIKVFTCHRRPQ